MFIFILQMRINMQKGDIFLMTVSTCLTKLRHLWQITVIYTLRYLLETVLLVL